MDVIIDQEDYRRLRNNDFQQLYAHNLTPYPHKFIDSSYQKMSVLQMCNKYNDIIKPGEHLDHDIHKIYIIVRIYSRRNASKKLIFMDGHEEGVKVQIMANLQKYIYAIDGLTLTSIEHFNLMTSIIRYGDLVGFAGIPCKTKMGELSLLVHHMELLSPCLQMLPPRTYENDDGKIVSGLQNTEVRYKQRYLDLIINEENLATFKKRSIIIKTIRNFLDNDLGLMEVDTPILNPTVGGASAKPFETFSIDYDCPMFMRIAPELYLKMLIVGGFKGVYEIGKQFRNESNDLTHNSEFTSLEYYIQNCDYNDLITQCEKLLTHIIETINDKSLIIQYDGKYIDFTAPFKRLDMIDTLEKLTNTKLPIDLSTEEAREFLDILCIKLNVECTAPRTTGRLLDKLVGHFIEPLCINPTFIIGHPKIMSPLAKGDRNGTNRAERFELFVNGKELANAYTELNDPIIQLETFQSQAKDKTLGDIEAMSVDAGFIKALEYGLPPTGGFGMGIDRLVMLLTNNTSIREVILFPTMKSI